MPANYSDIIQDVMGAREPVAIPEEQPESTLTLNRAIDRDPNTMVEVYDIARERQASPLTVEQNLQLLKKEERIKQLDHTKNPSLARFLANQENADVAHDDIGVLAALEDHLGAFNAGVMSFPEMVLGGTGTLIEVGGRTVERLLPEALTTAIQEFDKDIPAPSQLFTKAGELAGELGDYLAPEEETFSTQVAGGLGQVGAQIATMLVAPQAAVPTLFAQGVEQQAERQRQTGSEGESLETDMALLAGGGVTATIEKVGLDKLLNRVPPNIKNDVLRKISDIAIGGGYEALTEVAEGIGHGLIERMTTNPNADIFQGVKEEATVAGTVGAIVRALIPSYRGNARTTQITEVTDEAIKTHKEQEFIDTTISLAQESLLSQRSEKSFKKFIDGLPEKTEILIDPEAFNEYTGPLPEYVSEQLDGLGSDVAITVDQLAKDVVHNPEVLNMIRPYMKMTEGSLTQSELEAGEGSQSTVRNLLEEAQTAADMKVEADEVFEDVVQQLMGTGRLSETNARYSATLVPAYVTTKAKELGIGVKDIYDKMGLTVTKLEPTEPDFKGEKIERELTLEETGQKVKIRELKQVAYDRAVKRRDMASKLRDCLNG